MPPRNSNTMFEWHKLFLQSIMSRGYLTGKEVFILAKGILQENKYRSTSNFPDIDFSKNTDDLNAEIAEFIDNLLTVTNNNLEDLNMQIKKGFEEMPVDDKYEQYYAFCVMDQSTQVASFQKQYTEPQLEWLRLACIHIIEDEPNRLSTDIRLTNLCLQGGNNAAKKKLTALEAANALKMFISDGYLFKLGKRSKGGHIGIGARALLELDSWLRVNTDIRQCSHCSRNVVLEVRCPNRRCDNTVFHRQCLQKRQSKCSKCKEPIKIEGVASKR